MGMTYKHFAHTFSKNVKLYVQGTMYMDCMEYADKVNEADITLMDKYMEAGYKRYLQDDMLSPIMIGRALYWLFYDYFDSDADDDNIDIFNIEENLTKYITFALMST